MSEQVTIEDFSRNLNTKFKVYRTDEDIFDAELVEALELRNDDILYSFSVIFLLPSEFGFEQRIFKFEHSELGVLELFIVPVRQTDLGIRYEALFNYVIRE